MIRTHSDGGETREDNVYIAAKLGDVVEILDALDDSFCYQIHKTEQSLSILLTREVYDEYGVQESCKVQFQQDSSRMTSTELNRWRIYLTRWPSSPVHAIMSQIVQYVIDAEKRRLKGHQDV